MTKLKHTQRTDTTSVRRLERHVADLERLWDALSWLQTYDPGSVDDIEGEFQISVSDRRVDKRIAPVRRGVVT